MRCCCYNNKSIQRDRILSDDSIDIMDITKLRVEQEDRQQSDKNKNLIDEAGGTVMTHRMTSGQCDGDKSPPLEQIQETQQPENEATSFMTVSISHDHEHDRRGMIGSTLLVPENFHSASTHGVTHSGNTSYHITTMSDNAESNNTNNNTNNNINNNNNSIYSTLKVSNGYGNGNNEHLNKLMHESSSMNTDASINNNNSMIVFDSTSIHGSREASDNNNKNRRFFFGNELNNGINEIFEKDFNLVKQFTLRMFIILSTSIGQAKFETFFCQMGQILLPKFNLKRLDSKPMLSLALIFGFILLTILGLITLKYEKEILNSFNQFIYDPNNTKQDILDEIFNDAEIEELQITTSDGETTRGSRKEIGSGKRWNGKDNGKSNGKPSDFASYLLCLQWAKLNKTNQMVSNTINDILAALKAPENHFNFKLATCADRTLSRIIESNEMGVDEIFGIDWRTQEIYAQLLALAVMTWNISDVYGHSHDHLMFTISSEANKNSDIRSTSSSTSYSLQYWMDFVCSEFGLCDTTQEDEFAQLLDGIDSFNLPSQKQQRGSDQRLSMQGCPVILAVNTLTWTDIEANWIFVDDILAFGKYVNESKNEYRFNYWSNMFSYFRMMGKVSCDWGQNVTNEIVNDTLSIVNYFMAAMESKGSMGISTNIQQQLLLKKEVNGKMSDKYNGVTRMFVLSPRTSVFGQRNRLIGQYQENLIIPLQAAPDVIGIKLHYKTFDNDNEWMTMNMTQMNENRQIYSQQKTSGDGQ